ncbi:hypothetical protein CLQ_05138 [Clostridium botulinum Af84]|nr:hypothetical protein CLQ_05138 [Clostridium botulinum Af84]OPD20574.1 hypothetical protein AL710_11665 [Clostridium botulinum]OPD25252.1 hypothetical protein AL709_06770 [Clostridium botulinum]OPD27707.1 hypothetical protein AL398_00460 [Clostridium botulinum]
MVSFLGRKFLMESYLELLSKINQFMNGFFIFAILKLDLF